MCTLYRWVAMCALLLLPAMLWPQDVITTTAGKRIQAKVLDTKGNKVLYKYEGSRKYKMPKKDLSQIVYADGRVEHYAKGRLQTSEPAALPAPPTTKAPAAPVRSEKKAEGRKFLLGVSAGAGVATGRYAYKSYPPPDFSFRFAPAAGLGFDWRAGRAFALQMNLMYKEKGDRIQMERWSKQLIDQSEFEPGTIIKARGFQETRLQYIEASLLPVLVLGRRVELGAGAYLGYALGGNAKSDYSVDYYFPDAGWLDGDATQTETPITFIILAPETVEEGVLYYNRIDYGLCGHLGMRMNPVKLSLDVGYGLKTWEPDNQLSDLFFNSVNYTYNLSGVLTLSWYFGAR